MHLFLSISSKIRKHRRFLARHGFDILESRWLLAANHFAIIGDYGDNSNSAELAVANLVKSWDPAYVITLGDNNYPDGTASTIDTNIGKYYHEFIGNYTGSFGAGSSTNRFFPSLGNHDWNTSGAEPYLNYFTLPGSQFPTPSNERYYDFVQGPIHFFVIDSDSAEPHGTSSTSTQANWLQSRLATSTSPFNVVYFHHAPYSSGSHGSTTGMRWPFKTWGADVVLAGHDHVYERLTVDSLPYFVNGLGGRSLYSFSAPIAGSQVRYSANYGAQRVTVSSTSLTFEFYSIANGGTLIDRYVLSASSPTLPTLSINNVSVTEGNSSTVNAVFTASLSAASGQAVTVNYSTANGTATSGSDYTAKSGTVTFASGVTTQQISVVVNGDTLDEINETFIVNLSSAVGATIGDSQGLATITDNDAAPTITINNVTVTEGNSGTVNAVFTASLSAASGQTVTVNYATANGTATAGSDFTAKSGTVTFASGVTTQQISVAVIGDASDEANETFVVNLSNAVGATIGDSQGVATITDNDTASTTTITINNVTVTEGNSSTVNAVFTASLSAASGQTVTVNYATANGTATAGLDYTAKSGSITFASGVTTQQITVVVNGDTLDEIDETFVVNLSNAVGATIGDSQGVATISDNDAAPTIAINNITITEGNSGTVNAVFNVIASGPSGKTMTVAFATANGTATAPSDYIAKNGTVQLSPGLTTQTISVSINGDSLDEPNETFVINLTIPTNATISDGQGSATITDDDVAPPPPSGTLISAGATWRFLDTGVDQSTAWRSVTFSDSAWRSGPAQLGYGDGDEATLVSYGPNSANKYITTYFRHAFSVADPSQISGLTLDLLRDDGAVIYLNGQEVVRSNMPAGTIAFSTVAASWIDVADDNTFTSYSVNSGFLRSGTNVIAVEVHQAGPTSADLGFDLKLTFAATTLPPVTRAFQNGVSPGGSYAGTRDTKIRSSNPTEPKGSSNNLEVYGNPDISSLIKWDISTIPTGTVVQSVTFSIMVTNTSTNLYEVYALKRNWVENEATWNVFGNGASWQIAGAQGSNDRGSTALATVSSSTTGVKTFSFNSAGIALVQSWVNDPAANFGIIIQDYGSSDNLTFKSREVGTATERPKLTVTYIPGSSSSVAAFVAERSSATESASNSKRERRNRADGVVEPKRNHQSMPLLNSVPQTGIPSSLSPEGSDGVPPANQSLDLNSPVTSSVETVDAAIAQMRRRRAGSIRVSDGSLVELGLLQWELRPEELTIDD